MKTTIRIFQPWAALLVLLCGCLSAFGQSAPNFNVTVTETTASGCGECEPLELQPSIVGSTDPSEPNGIIDPCLNSGTGIFSVTPVTFNVDIDLSNVILDEEESITYQISSKVYYENSSGAFIPVQVMANGNNNGFSISSMFSYTSYGNTAILIPGDMNSLLNFNINIDVIDPGAHVNDYFFFEFIFTPGEMDDDDFVPNSEQDKRYMPYVMVPRCDIGPISDRIGLDNSISAVDINLYPNPSTESHVVIDAQIPTSGNSTPESAQIDLYNLQGQKIMSLKKALLDSTGKLTQKINIESLAKGIYIVEVSAGKYQANSKLIKQ